ncbi:hypothetical protein CTI12_AA039270 [Artemisia annua]|uniref:Uncharacterized protein n=1 Tax=Artemisia annua TaxID=35608 RepID=A0A2U1QEN5_ARTAN|nr:hypothetical protein CTI12_AA039270 [Artemisia annua]
MLDPCLDKKISLQDETPSFIAIIVHSISIMEFTDSKGLDSLTLFYQLQSSINQPSLAPPSPITTTR